MVRKMAKVSRRVAKATTVGAEPDKLEGDEGNEYDEV